MASVEQWKGRKLILGLGNPGERYAATRHNRGREVIEELARRWGRSLDTVECGARIAVSDLVVLAAPDTYMNRSGYAARCLVERRGLAPEDMLVVYDEAALPLGALRLRHRGGAGGQNGMASVLESLQTDEVPRLRLGVGPIAGLPGGSDLVEYVLSPFDDGEARLARDQIQTAADACELWLAHGTEAAMNRFNGSPTTVLGVTDSVEEQEE